MVPRVTTALAPETPTERLNACLDAYAEPLVARYFDGSSGFAGATFDTLGDNPWNRITRDDLLALTCLDEHVSPAALRWLLGDEGQAKCTEMLTGISPTVILGRAEDVEPLAAARRARKMLLARPSIGPVKASKLLSRKRPLLIPIVDRRPPRRAPERLVDAPPNPSGRPRGHRAQRNLLAHRLRPQGTSR